MTCAPANAVRPRHPACRGGLRDHPHPDILSATILDDSGGPAHLPPRFGGDPVDWIWSRKVAVAGPTGFFAAFGFLVSRLLRFCPLAIVSALPWFARSPGRSRVATALAAKPATRWLSQRDRNASSRFSATHDGRNGQPVSDINASRHSHHGKDATISARRNRPPLSPKWIWGLRGSLARIDFSTHRARRRAWRLLRVAGGGLSKRVK
jgi:hypothetical protein